MRKTLYVFVMLLLVAAMSLPSGAPMSNVAHAAGTTYYLSPSGDNANNGTSPSTPWKTLKKAAGALQAGDTLLMMGGTYVSSSSNNEFFFSPSNSGTAANPITVKAYNHEVPIITGGTAYGSWITLSDKSYYVIEGIHFENITNGYSIYGMHTDHITIRNCVFKNTSSTQVDLHGSYLVIENNVFDTAGSPAAEGSGDNLFLLGTTYSLVQNNYFTKGGHYSIDVIDLEGTPKLFAHHNVIRNNYIDQGWGGGIGVIRGSTQTLVERNFIKNAGVAVTTYPKTGIQLAAEQNIVRNNIISNTGPNLSFDEGMAALAYRFSGIDQNVRDNRVYNNNIYKSGRDALMFSQRGATQLTRNKFVNNIFYYNRMTGDYNQYWPTGNYYFTVETYHAFSDNKWPNFPNENYMYNNEILHADATGDQPGEILFYYDQDNWRKSLSDVEADYPAYIYDNLESNPQYADADGDDFSLQSSSPMINAGAHLAQTTAAGASTTVVPVDDPWFFFDGYNIVSGDTVKIGSNALVTVTAVNTSANTITVDSPVTFASGDNVDIAYNGSSLDIGAVESGDVPWTPVQYYPTLGDGQIALSWGTVSGATGYKVKYGTTSGSYTTTLDVGDVTSKTVSGLTNSTPYYFVVSAYNSNGESSNSFEKYGIPNGQAPAVPAAPTQSAPTAGDGQITVNWSSVSGATGYNVKYGTTSGSHTTSVDEGNVTSAVISGLTNGATYYFVVTAYNASGESVKSNEQSAAPQAASGGDIVVLKNGVNGYAGNTSFAIRGDDPSTHYNQSAYGHWISSFSGTSQYMTRAFYKFDVSPLASGIPANATITSAQLKLYVDSSGDSANEVAAYRVAPVNNAFAIDYSAATRNTYDGTNAWTGGSNGAGNPADADNDFVDIPDDQQTVPASPGYITLDVTSSVQGWIDGAANDGWLVRMTNPSIQNVSGKLGTAGDLYGSTHYPELTITYASAPTQSNVVFKNGVNGYAGSSSFGVRADSPSAHKSQASYGHWTNAFSGTSSYNIRAYYKFDVSSIPANATIESAELKLQMVASGGYEVNIYRMAPVNGAFTVDYTAATHDTYDGVNSWTGGANAAGDTADSDNDFIDTPDDQVVAPASGSFTLDVSDSVQAWVNGAANNGWMINTTTGSAEFGTAGDLHGSSYYPELAITYTP